MTRQQQRLSENIADWVAHYVERQQRLNWMGCVGCAVAAAPVLFLTFWVIYAVLWIGFQSLLTTHLARLLGSGGVLGLIFVAYATANWQYLRVLKFESADRLATARLAAFATGQTGFSLLAGPQTAHTFVKVISVTLLLGPGLIDLALRLAGRARLLRELNVAAVAQALTCLLEAEGRVAVEDLASIAGIDEERLMLSLSQVDGVVSLKSGEPAVTLNDELRRELIEHRATKSED
jgi:hypothetical protein